MSFASVAIAAAPFEGLLSRFSTAVRGWLARHAEHRRREISGVAAFRRTLLERQWIVHHQPVIIIIDNKRKYHTLPDQAIKRPTKGHTRRLDELDGTVVAV